MELHIFNNLIIEIQQSDPPGDASPESLEARKEEIAKPARRMLLGFIQQVVPTLIAMEWDTDVDNITLSELFAKEIETSLADVKKSVAHGSKPILFDKGTVCGAMGRAQTKLDIATGRIGRTEKDLARLTPDFGVVQKRAKWPIAEYSCRFFYGHLLPTELDIMNDPENCPKCESRRGLREGGWMVRDRFCRVTNVFQSGEELVEWISCRPNLCGRRYEFLFDKGVGTSLTIW